MSASIQTVGICGAGGTMGTGIAIVAARAGNHVVCFDRNAAALDRVVAQMNDFFAKSVSRGKMSEREHLAALGRVALTTDSAALQPCELVIEAIFEDLEAKRQLLAELGRVCSSDTIIASNTSTLSITEIASGSANPNRVVGMHFCLPAQIMKLVEMTPGLLTDTRSFEAAWTWCVGAGQTAVRTQDRPGFILNAILVPFNNDAIRAVEAGVATPADIDKAIKMGLGHKMGPMELLDMIGLDTQVRLSEAFFASTHDPRAAAPPLLRRMVAAGMLGRKSGRGFFTYPDQTIFGG